jgi:hypothetical protein
MKYLSIIVFSIVLGSCGVNVNTMQDNAVDFSQYKTFCWLKGCEFTYSGPSYLDDSLLQENIKGAIIAELEEKGIVKDENNPDLLIDFHITIENETSRIYHQIDESYEYQPLPEINDEIIHYLKGTMIIDIVDKAQAKMVWRSETINYMDLHPELTAKNIRKGIALTMKKFPPEN